MHLCDKIINYVICVSFKEPEKIVTNSAYSSFEISFTQGPEHFQYGILDTVFEVFDVFYVVLGARP